MIRLATADDAVDLGQLHSQSWRETYVGIVSDEWIAQISEAERIATWQRILGKPNPATQWVAEMDGRIVGFAASGPSRDPEPVRHVELWSLYVLRRHQRTGLGSALLDAAIADQPASLWVAEDNAPARAFYTAAGFAADGASAVLDRMDGITEIRMLR